jgi:hypothetical protein
MREASSSILRCECAISLSFDPHGEFQARLDADTDLVMKLVVQILGVDSRTLSESSLRDFLKIHLETSNLVDCLLDVSNRQFDLNEHLQPQLSDKGLGLHRQPTVPK